MKKSAVVIGLSGMGGVFAHGFPRPGHTVYPVIRTGRRAPRRLARALAHADPHGLGAPTLRAAARGHRDG